MLAHLFAGCLAAFAALPDIIPRGYHGISVTVRFEAKPLLEHCCTQHIVKKGETLSKIATARLWGAEAIKDIVALNPGLTPDVLKVGQRIWLPPTDKTARTQAKTYAFSATGWQFGWGSKPFVALASPPPPRYGVLTLFLVHEKHLKAVQAAKNNSDLVQGFLKDGRIQPIKVSCPGRLVKDGDPTHKRVDTVTFKRDKKGKFSGAVTSVRYDKKGKVITPATIKKLGSKQGSWLLMLPACGLGWLLLRRRRATVIPATA